MKEYLLSDRSTIGLDLNIQNCHASLAEGCLRYLMHLFDRAPLTEEVAEQYPLARYAAEHWWQHAQKIDGALGHQLLELTSELLNGSGSALLSWVQLFNAGDPSSLPDLTTTSSDISQPLFYAATVGLPEVVASIIAQDVDLDAYVGRDCSALEAAAWYGHEKIVQMLLDAGANISARGGDGGNALQAASRGHYERVVRFLLGAGADVNAKTVSDPAGAHLGARLGTALEAAAGMSFEGIVRILLDAGADFESRFSALVRTYDNSDVLRLLLETFDDVSFKKYYPELLTETVLRRNKLAVRMLLDAGANCSTHDEAVDVALRGSIRGSSGEIMRMLLEAGARLEESSSLLYIASEESNKGTVEILLGAGVDVNMSCGTFNRPLQAAAANKHRNLLDLLLKAGADVNAQGGYYGDALQAACSSKRAFIGLNGVRHYQNKSFRRRYKNGAFELSITGTDIELELLVLASHDVEDERGGITLQAIPKYDSKGISEVPQSAGVTFGEIECCDTKTQRASLIDGLEAVIEILLAPSIEEPPQRYEHESTKFDLPVMCYEKIFEIIQSSGGFYSESGTARESESVVQALADAGAVIKSLPTTSLFGPPRFRSRNASTKIVKLLLEAGANINTQGGVFGNALQAASEYAHTEVVQELLECGANSNAQGGEFGSALQAACAAFTPNEELVQMLLDAGVNVNAPGGIYGNALQAASYKGSGNLMRMLLDAGADVNAQGGCMVMHYKLLALLQILRRT